MAVSWKDKKRVVIVIIDYSDSMRIYSESVSNGCSALKNGNTCSDTEYHFIGFSDIIKQSRDILDLKHMRGSTCIAPAFECVSKLLVKHGQPGQIDVVFISDGVDDSMPRCIQTLSQLPMPPCRSRLFCVGVRSGFPTSLVTDHLYPKFGRDSDVSAPPVIPLESNEEAPWVFEQLAVLLSTDKELPPPLYADFTDASTAQELCSGAKRVTDICSALSYCECR